MRYFKKIPGERLYLSPIHPGDAETYTRWINDHRVSANLGNYRQNIGLNTERETLERMADSGQNYAIVLEETDTLIGNISLMDIDSVCRRATLGLFIGEEEHRGKGYGAEAIRLILDYGFRTLNLHNIMLQVHSDNAPAMACYRKVGFREFGRRREALFKDGGYHDIVHMDILDTEFALNTTAS